MFALLETVTIAFQAFGLFACASNLLFLCFGEGDGALFFEFEGGLERNFFQVIDGLIEILVVETWEGVGG